jgi:hypothetical protein
MRFLPAKGGAISINFSFLLKFADKGFFGKLKGGRVLKSALICGGGGFIGSHLPKRLKREGFRVPGVDLKFP